MSALDRRKFVGLTVGAAVSAAGTACASMVTYRVAPEDGVVRLDPLEHPPLRGSGGFLRVQPEGSPGPIYVLALERGGFTAVSPICTHRGCTVDVAGDSLVCPCHGSTYDRQGNVLEGPAQRSLTSFPVLVDADGTIVIRIENR